MARYTAARCRLCRREGVKLFLKGEKCYTEKCPIVRRGYPPGEHGQFRRKLSEYGVQLREKQKARRIYGIGESAFRRYFEKASKKKGVTGVALLQLLELRLDNVVYRAGLAASRAEARQLVRHGHFKVNGRRVDIPSYSVKTGDIIEPTEKGKNLSRLRELADAAEEHAVKDWLEVDYDNMRIRVLRLPERDEIDVPVQEQLIVELYSR